MEIMGYELREGCRMFPEEYNVFRDGEQVAYLRLRHGYFCAEVPDACGELVYDAEPEGTGHFEVYERGHYLCAAIEAVDRHLSAPSPISPDGPEYQYVPGFAAASSKARRGASAQEMAECDCPCPDVCASAGCALGALPDAPPEAPRRRSIFTDWELALSVLLLASVLGSVIALTTGAVIALRAWWAL